LHTHPANVVSENKLFIVVEMLTQGSMVVSDDALQYINHPFSVQNNG
jgi:hypothetical protein